MAVGALSYLENGLYPAYNASADAARRVAPAAQGNIQPAPLKNATEKMPPIDPKTAQNAKIYSLNRPRVIESAFDDAPLTKNKAHVRARAKAAMDNLPSGVLGASVPRASRRGVLSGMSAARGSSFAGQDASAAPGGASSGRANAARMGGAGKSRASALAKSATAKPQTGCSTCDSRVYQDVSNDSGVSFQSPTGMPASTSGVRVAAHEGEHVTRETERAFKEGSVVTQKKVTMHAAFCPECHRLYYAGGTTTIATTSAQDTAIDGLSVRNAADSLNNLGNSVDMVI